jgi:hypothetical protein
MRSGAGIDRSCNIGAQNGALTSRVVWSAERRAHWIADPCESRHTDGTGEVGNHRQRDRRDVARFEDAVHQSHGPATEGSRRYEAGSIDAILTHALGDRRRRLFDQLRGLKSQVLQLQISLDAAKATGRALY